ncbi:MAG: NAD(P)-dependent oxidoreductase [Candidatus Nanopelagicales bacterium]
MTADPVALLGAGKMGAALVDRWAEAGRPVVVWNRSAAGAQALARDGVTASATIADAVRGCSVVVTSLTDGPALVDVLLEQGGLAALAPGTTLVDLSTVDVASSERVAAAASERGIAYVRGAVSGSPLVVRSGAASLLLSGPADAIASARDVLTDVTAAHHVLGEGEQARVVKIAVNSMLGATMQLLAEATVLVESAGVEREAFLDALDGTVMASRFVSYKGAALRARDYAATFRMIDMRKDLDLAVSLGAASGVPLPVASAVLARTEEAVAAGYADDDFLALVCVEQAAAGRPVDLAREPVDPTSTPDRREAEQ